jgi:hypothetical protein
MPPAKPSVSDLGVDLESLPWRGSGDGPGTIQVAFVTASGADWVLLRVQGDDQGLVSVFSRHEWECFLDGARSGEFDAATRPPGGTPPP